MNKELYKPGTYWDKMRQARLEATKEQRAKRAQEQKAIRKLRKEHGLCVNCGKKDALPGITLCMDCRLYHNQSRSGYVVHTDKWLKKERKAGRL